MRGTGSVALLAAYVPFGNGFCLDVVIDRMAAITKRPGGSQHIVGWIKTNPPVGVGRDHVSPPNLMGHIPLRPERIVVITLFCEVPLFPLTAVYEGNIVDGEFHERVWFGEIGKDRVGVRFGVADDVGHSSLAPTRIDKGVTGLARCRANELETRGGRLAEQNIGYAADYKRKY